MGQVDKVTVITVVYNDANNIRKTIMSCLDQDYPDVEYITLQGETYGKDIQKRSYGLNEHRFAAFNFIIGFKNEQKRLNPVQMTKFLELYDIPCVPIVDTALILPETCDEMLEIAGGPSAIDGEMREGLVMRSYGGEKSFKAVDSNYLIKYHQ